MPTTLEPALPPYASLRGLALAFAAGSLLLVALTVALGGVGLFLWHQSTQESLRLTALVEEMQGVRGGLYRQMKEVFDATFLQDGEAQGQYLALSRQLEARLENLDTMARPGPEQTALNRLASAYRSLRAHTDPLLVLTRTHSSAEERRLLETELEQGSMRRFETAFGEIEQQVSEKRTALEHRHTAVRRLWTLLLALPVVGMLLVLLWSRLILRKYILGPLVDLREATGIISRGNLEHRAPQRGAREIAELARSINQMAAELAASRNSLVRAEKQESLGALVPVLAHNIRNPLASIRATAQVLGDGALERELQDGLRGIIATTDRLERWTHSLLSYLNPFEPQRVALDAGTLANTLLPLLNAHSSQKPVQVDLSNWQRDLVLWADPLLLEQALHGLVTNALEASPPGATVALGLRRDPSGGIQIDIDDTGPGMPFEPTPQGLTPGPTTKPLGTGLGIAFAAKVCDVHGGSLHFLRREPAGTRVRLVLPA